MILETTTARKKTYNHFIGIDVSKNTLDYAVRKGDKLLFHEQGKNEPEKILDFITRLKGLEGFVLTKCLFCFEHTGFYTNHLLNFLKKIKANVAMVPGLQVKNSLGMMRGKDDKADAKRLAVYAQKNSAELKLWMAKRPVVLELMNLVALRRRLLNVSVVLSTPLKEQTRFVKNSLQKQSVQLCRRTNAAIKDDLTAIDLVIDSLINADENLKKLNQLITSVPSVGPVTAIHVIISTNEFKDINNPKKFACYAGVAPFKVGSGLIEGKARISHLANKNIKALLHVCALNAIRCDQDLKAYFERKTKSEGKPKRVVINAIRCKLILRIFACVNQNRTYAKERKSQYEITAGEPAN
jgi:transposase